MRQTTVRPRPRTAFGLKQQVAVGAQPLRARASTSGAAVSGARAPQPRVANGATLVVRHSAQAAYLAMAIAVLLWHRSDVFQRLGDVSARFELIGWLGLAVLAGVWAVQGTFGTTAVCIGADGVRGMTLLGERHMAWSDVRRLEAMHTKHQGDYLLIHGRVDGRLWELLRISSIHVGARIIDRPPEDVVEAIRTWRPDLPDVVFKPDLPQS